MHLCAKWPLRFFIRIMRHLNNIQLSCEELELIIATIKSKTSCNLLVFGLGLDSNFWTKTNKNGHTVFLEDNELWFKTILKKNKKLKAYLVKYSTNRTQRRVAQIYKRKN